MKIDDPKTYDYVKYMLDHYNPTNEGFKEKGLKEVAMIDSRIMDDTNKVIGQSVFMLKGKDFSNKIDEFIAGLKKGQKENKLNEEYIEDLKHKIFVPDDDDNSASNALSSHYSVHLNKYLDILSGAYASTLEGEGNGHSTIDKEGNLISSDYTFENFKKSYESFYIEEDSANINFAISDSFKNRPIVRGNYMFLTKEQYLQDKDKIIDYLKNKIAFGNFTSRHMHISSSKAFNDDNSEVLPANIKSAFDEEELKKLNNAKSFNIIYDKQHINYQNSSHAKNDLSNADYLLNKNVLSDNSFTLSVNNGETGYKSVDLPFNYYLSENDKPIYKADSKLKFKEKSDIVGSKYYISNTHNDTDIAIKEYKKILLSELKDDENFNKLTKEEQNTAINETLSNIVENMNEVHKDDKENIKKYQVFLNSEKWGNQRLTQYIGNVDTQTEEFNYNTIKKDDPTLQEGQTKVAVKGIKGKKVTKITYKVDRATGELMDPVSEVVEDTKPIDEVVLIGTKKVIPASTIEDIAKTTKVSKEVIKGKTIYEADSSLDFEKKNEIKKPIDGEKEITTISQKGQKDQVSEKITKESVDGLTKVGNKKVEIKKEGDITITTTTIYEVDKNTGKLINPKVSVNKSTNFGNIEDIAKTTKVSKEVIKGKTIYEADDSLDFEKKNEIKKVIDGEKEITTISQKGQKDKISEKIIKKSQDGLIKIGNKKVETKKDGDITITTTTIYEVDKNSGKLINPKVSVNKSADMKKVEDISAKTTHTDIDYNKVYVGQADLKYKEEKIFQKGVKGKKEITQIGSGKATEKVIAKATSEIIGIGNRNIEEKEVEINGKKGKKLTTTIWEVDKNTGKLINPKVTSKTIFNMENIEDIAKKSMHWTNIEDIAKRTSIPAEKIQDIAKKNSIPAEKIQDIAKKTSIPTEKIQDIAKIDDKEIVKTSNEKTISVNKDIKTNNTATTTNNTEKQTIMPVSSTNVQTGIENINPALISAVLSSVGLALTNKKKKED